MGGAEDRIFQASDPDPRAEWCGQDHSDRKSASHVLRDHAAAHKLRQDIHPRPSSEQPTRNQGLSEAKVQHSQRKVRVRDAVVLADEQKEQARIQKVGASAQSDRRQGQPDFDKQKLC